jgi:virginiamycin B lyase
VVDAPTAIIRGAGTTLWFTSHDSHTIQSISTGGAVSSPFLAGSGPGDLILGADGTLWFTDLDGQKIGAIASDGTGHIIEWIPVTGGGQPFALSGGPDGHVWFTVEKPQGPSAADAVCRVT